jgi:hypothetical protein
LIVPNEFETCVKANSELIEREEAVLPHRQEPQSRASSLSDQLPRHEIAVMLHLAEQNHVACAQECSAPRLRDEVDALARATREHNLVRRGSAEIARHARPRAFVSFRCARTQLVQTSMHVRVVMFVVVPERIDHGARLL